jgi:hypothetical protein
MIDGNEKTSFWNFNKREVGNDSYFVLSIGADLTLTNHSIPENKILRASHYELQMSLNDEGSNSSTDESNINSSLLINNNPMGEEVIHPVMKQEPTDKELTNLMMKRLDLLEKENYQNKKEIHQLKIDNEKLVIANSITLEELNSVKIENKLLQKRIDDLTGDVLGLELNLDTTRKEVSSLKTALNPLVGRLIMEGYIRKITKMFGKKFTNFHNFSKGYIDFNGTIMNIIHVFEDGYELTKREKAHFSKLKSELLNIVADEEGKTKEDILKEKLKKLWEYLSSPLHSINTIKGLGLSYSDETNTFARDAIIILSKY